MQRDLLQPRLQDTCTSDVSYHEPALQAYLDDQRRSGHTACSLPGASASFTVDLTQKIVLQRNIPLERILLSLLDKKPALRIAMSLDAALPAYLPPAPAPDRPPPSDNPHPKPALVTSASPLPSSTSTVRSVLSLLPLHSLVALLPFGPLLVGTFKPPARASPSAYLTHAALLTLFALALVQVFEVRLLRLKTSIYEHLAI